MYSKVTIAALAQLAQHLEAVHAGHAPIQQDDVRGVAGGETIDPFPSAREASDIEALVGEIEAQGFPELVVIIDQEDSRGLGPRGTPG